MTAKIIPFRRRRPPARQPRNGHHPDCPYPDREPQWCGICRSIRIAAPEHAHDGPAAVHPHPGTPEPAQATWDGSTKAKAAGAAPSCSRSAVARTGTGEAPSGR